MYNIRLYPLACKQRWVFNMLTVCIPSIFKFHVFGKFLIFIVFMRVLRVNHLVVIVVDLKPYLNQTLRLTPKHSIEA